MSDGEPRIDPLELDTMVRNRAKSASERLHEAVDLMAFAHQQMRANLKRRDPAATSGQIEARLRHWMLTDS